MITEFNERIEEIFKKPTIAVHTDLDVEDDEIIYSAELEDKQIEFIIRKNIIMIIGFAICGETF